MRTIKFRAWDSDLDLMMPEVDLSTALQHYKWLGRKDLPIMQFTGLFDKNGREIYEGDVVREEHNSRYEVVFEEGRFQKKCNSGLYVLQNTHYQEILGNIYQNPELIN